MKSWWMAGMLFMAATAYAGQLEVHVPNLTPDAEGRLGVLFVNLCDNKDCYDPRRRRRAHLSEPATGGFAGAATAPKHRPCDVYLPQPPHRDLLGRPASRPRQRRRRHLRHLLPRQALRRRGLQQQHGPPAAMAQTALERSGGRRRRSGHPASPSTCSTCATESVERRLARADRQHLQPSQNDVVPEYGAVRFHVEVGETFQEGLEGEAAFQPGQRCAEAVMDAAPKGNVIGFLAAEVEAVRLAEHFRVAVGGARGAR